MDKQDEQQIRDYIMFTIELPYERNLNRSEELAGIQNEAILLSILNKKNVPKEMLLKWIKEDHNFRMFLEKRNLLDVINNEYLVTNKESDVKETISVELTLSKGQELYKDGKFNEAINLLEKASGVYKVAELLSDVLSDRGTAYIKMGQYESGFADFLRASEVNPLNWRACVNLCSVAKERGDIKFALEMGKKALKLHKELSSNVQFMELLSTLEVSCNELRINKRWWQF